ncbi:hypothetical protein CVT25_015216 [Psilocybe cyanescens]|uniref:BTB domain-containing protein n=1 Tax=Psilocybe cyanescens TaxID=93625 RepID=A0A409XR75_PSICY|nr:hypothetical protein CVT25_015216 [Psilocybe cyanescens]
MPSFQPRIFPPPSLTDVPVEYITSQLHSLATEFWDQPETADCTIIVPFPHAQGRPELPAFSQISVIAPTFSYTTSYDSTSLGRRVTQPPLNAVPRISLPLHIDYLSAHSSFLRGLFSGALPLDLMYSTAPPSSSSSSSVPADRQPRLMPCSPDHPILFLPVPDPSTFHLLVHWMYFGDFKYIQECLLKGSIQWEGIARNVEYLGLTADIKIFLGNWYHAWLNPERETEFCSDGDSDTVYSDSDDDDDCSTASELDDIIENDSEKYGLRGRVAGIHSVSFQSFQSLRSPSV